MTELNIKINIDSTSIDEAINKMRELNRLIDEYHQKQNSPISVPYYPAYPAYPVIPYYSTMSSEPK